ncbi:membrane protein [Gordoniibacillus kamchatkensis]|uniref:Membrane protein n=1 Tax=Gordoniibacillus kamchatkensis TaxID=1590651 RepID=A0ABR5ADE4_9BACL|nr:M50 family metallopeptidase [Paenibacillus sp. VKM B-2647]KIL38858.1 membrane protein [Paenibacillus sp. VKM B-2647]
MGNWVKTFALLLVSAVLTRFIPFSSFFRNVDTLVHEFGHAVVTLLLSGKVMYIELYVDHSGVTYSSVTKPWTTIPIALAGYMTASLFAWLLFRLYAAGKQRTGLQIVTLISVAALALFVRNPFGITWLLGFIALTVLILAFAPRWLTSGYYLLIAFLSLEESVFGPLSLTFTAYLSPRQAGDATNLALHTPLPAVAWAAVFSVFALWCATKALQSFFRAGRRAAAPPTYGRQYE